MTCALLSYTPSYTPLLWPPLYLILIKGLFILLHNKNFIIVIPWYHSSWNKYVCWFRMYYFFICQNTKSKDLPVIVIAKSSLLWISRWACTQPELHAYRSNAVYTPIPNRARIYVASLTQASYCVIGEINIKACFCVPKKWKTQKTKSRLLISYKKWVSE